MIAKCQCQQCGQNVEFDADQFQRHRETPQRFLGQIIKCPACRKPTQLYMERLPSPQFKVVNPVNNKLTTCKDCGSELSKNAFTCPKCGSFQDASFWLLIKLAIRIVLVISLVGLFWAIFNIL